MQEYVMGNGAIALGALAAGVKDTCYLIKAATEFFNSCIVAEGNGNYSLGE